MAYMSQERKSNLAPAIKRHLARYRVKGSIAVDNHSTLVVNIKSGALDFIGNANAIASQHPRNQSGRFQPARDDRKQAAVREKPRGKRQDFPSVSIKEQQAKFLRACG